MRKSLSNMAESQIIVEFSYSVMKVNEHFVTS